MGKVEKRERGRLKERKSEREERGRGLRKRDRERGKFCKWNTLSGNGNYIG